VVVGTGATTGAAVVVVVGAGAAVVVVTGAAVVVVTGAVVGVGVESDDLYRTRCDGSTTLSRREASACGVDCVD
jgi:hypothetical protein